MRKENSSSHGIRQLTSVTNPINTRTDSSQTNTPISLGMEPGYRTIVAVIITVIISLMFPDIFYSELMKVLILVIQIVGWLNSIQWFYRLINAEMEAGIMNRVERIERFLVNGGIKLIDLVVISLRVLRTSLKVIRDTMLACFRFMCSLFSDKTYPPIIEV